jgi:hypothetical protein
VKVESENDKKKTHAIETETTAEINYDKKPANTEVQTFWAKH